MKQYLLYSLGLLLAAGGVSCKPRAPIAQPAAAQPVGGAVQAKISPADAPVPKAADSPAPVATADSSAALKAAAALYGDIREETLPNGMRVFLKVIPESPVVTTMVVYRVGSADEELDFTGLSHYLEHLMFKGTEKLFPGDIDRITLRNGGFNNAYTSEDCTAYHFDFAADRWEAALEVEADRMRNLRIDARHEFEQEKGAVIEELRQGEDQPWDLEQKAILPLLFGPQTPYGHPIIGQAEHVRAATAEVIKAHYDKWYHPNNATLIVCGGIDADKALARIKELFGPIPRTELPPRKTLPEQTSERPVSKEIESKFDSPRLMMGFNTIRRDHPDYYALDIVQALLSGGKTGRLYKQLVEGEEMATDVASYNQAGRYPGWFCIEVAALPDANCEAIEAIVRAELRRLCEQPALEQEIKRVKQMLLTADIFDREGVHALTDSIAHAIAVGDLSLAREYLPGIMKVTAADVQRVATKYLEPKLRVSVWSMPKEEEKEKKDKEQVARGARVAGRPAVARQKSRGPAGAESAGERAVAEARRVELPNGLVLLLSENHRLPLFVAEAHVDKVRLMEPSEKAGITELVGYLLDEGTAKHSGAEISSAMAEIGATLSFDSSSGSLRVLSSEWRPGLSMFFECLMSANFPTEAVDRVQEQLLAAIDEAETQPSTKAQMAYLAKVYGEHPYGRPSHGRHETVAALTREDCEQFHRQAFVPNNAVIALVGDFDTQQVIDEVKRLTADWKKRELPTLEPPRVDKPPAFLQEIIPMPLAAQTHIFLGHVGVRRDNPDWYKLEVMDHVLGTAPGFTDRLSSRLRDREGLAYSVGANIADSATDEPGTFTAFIGTDAKNFLRVKTLLLEELTRIRTEQPSPSEVNDAKQYLLGSMPFKLTTCERIALWLVEIERYHLGRDYSAQYRRAIEAVTPEDVFAVAEKYLDPARMVLVAAGALDDKGQVTGTSDPKGAAGESPAAKGEQQP